MTYEGVQSVTDRYRSNGDIARNTIKVGKVEDAGVETKGGLRLAMTEFHRQLSVCDQPPQAILPFMPWGKKPPEQLPPWYTMFSTWPMVRGMLRA